jgi:hypothetical protein
MELFVFCPAPYFFYRSRITTMKRPDADALVCECRNYTFIKMRLPCRLARAKTN